MELIFVIFLNRIGGIGKKILYIWVSKTHFMALDVMVDINGGGGKKKRSLENESGENKENDLESMANEGLYSKKNMLILMKKKQEDAKKAATTPSPAARRSAIMNRNADEEDKKSILRKVYDKVTGQD
jgi:hypothetical protein